MGVKKFSIGDVIGESWAIIKKNIWIFAGTLLGFGLILGLLNMLFMGGAGAMSALSNPDDIATAIAAMFGIGAILSYLISLVISAFFCLGFYKMALDAADGKTPELSSFGLITFKKIINLFFANFLYIFAVYLGTFLCIVPGIFLGVRLQFYAFFIVEKDYSAINALAKSWECTNGESLNLILFGLALMLVNMLGAIICGIGLLVTVPMSIIAIALVYRLFVGSPVEQVDFETISDETAPTV